MHRDHGLPPVAFVGVFVLFPPPLLSVVPGLAPVPGLFGVPILRLSLLSRKGGCTNAISHLLADSGYCPCGRSLQEKRVESGHRPKYRYHLSFFEAITNGRRPKNRALQCKIHLLYLPMVTGLRDLFFVIIYTHTWVLVAFFLVPHTTFVFVLFSR